MNDGGPAFPNAPGKTFSSSLGGESLMPKPRTLESKLARLIHDHGFSAVDGAVLMVREILQGTTPQPRTRAEPKKAQKLSKIPQEKEVFE